MNPVIAKIMKLLAMTDTSRGATEAEAATATLMVQRILQDHGLTMAAVEQAGGEVGPDGKRSKEAVDRRALFRWQQQLMESLASNFFCFHMVETHQKHDGRKLRKSKQHVLIGRFINVQSTVNMYDYLAKAIRRAAVDHGYDHANNEKDHHMFLEGAAERLRVRLDDKRVEREREDAAKAKERAAQSRHPGAAPIVGTALVVADVYESEEDANNDIRYGYPPGTHAARRATAKAAKAAREALYQSLLAQGVEDIKAQYISYGYSDEAAQKMADDYHRPAEPTKPRKEREYKFRSASQKEQERWARQSSTAYKQGDAAARNIGLDDQVTSQDKRRIA